MKYKIKKETIYGPSLVRGEVLSKREYEVMFDPRGFETVGNRLYKAKVMEFDKNQATVVAESLNEVDSQDPSCNVYYTISRVLGAREITYKEEFKDYKTNQTWVVKLVVVNDRMTLQMIMPDAFYLTSDPSYDSPDSHSSNCPRVDEGYLIHELPAEAFLISHGSYELVEWNSHWGVSGEFAREVRDFIWRNY